VATRSAQGGQSREGGEVLSAADLSGASGYDSRGGRERPECRSRGPRRMRCAPERTRGRSRRPSEGALTPRRQLRQLGRAERTGLARIPSISDLSPPRRGVTAGRSHGGEPSQGFHGELGAGTEPQVVPAPGFLGPQNRPDPTAVADVTLTRGRPMKVWRSRCRRSAAPRGCGPASRCRWVSEGGERLSSTRGLNAEALTRRTTAV